MKKILMLGAALILSACNASTPPPADTAAATPAADSAPATVAADPAPPATSPAESGFTDKVWQVSASSAVQVGSTYTFLGNGTLVVDAPSGTPLYGRWAYAGGELTMTEEGLTYPTDIVHLDADTFQIRSHNPGGTVDISLVPMPGAALPPAEPMAVEGPGQRSELEPPLPTE